MLQYLIKLSISLAVMYLFYRLVLRPLTFYAWNRFYLLGYSLLSFVIPVINIGSWMLKGDSAEGQLVNIIPVLGNYTQALRNQPAATGGLFQQLTAGQWLLLLFCIGAALMLLRIAVQYLSLRNVRNQSLLLNTSKENVKLYRTTARVTPFSFGNAIYFNGDLHSDEELQRIIQHEFVHVRQKHSFDIMVGELLCVINWFNPFAWLIRHAIRQNLEFIADNDVITNGFDRKEYQYLLLKVVGVSQYSIASHFNFSNLKKRIAMMNKMKSARHHLARFMFALPLLAVLLLAFRNNKPSSDDRAHVPNRTTGDLVALVQPAENNQDTVPPPPPASPVAPVVNKNGYIITVADNSGECVVLVKDKAGKIVKALALTEWNSNKGYEDKYGIIAPPRVLTIKSDVAPAAAAVPVLPAPPARPTPRAQAEKKATASTTAVAPAEPGLQSPDLDQATEPKSSEVNEEILSEPVQPPPATEEQEAAVVVNNGKLDKDYARYGNVELKNINNVLNPPLYILNGKEMPADWEIKRIDARRIESISVLKDKNAVAAYGTKGKNGVILVTLKRTGSAGLVNKKVDFGASSQSTGKPFTAIKGSAKTKKSVTQDIPEGVLFFIDGEETSRENVEKLDPSKIEVMNVTTAENAVKTFGARANKGVIEITTKRASSMRHHADDTMSAEADTIIFAQHLVIKGGRITGKNNKVFRLDGQLSLEHFEQMPLVMYNGAQVRDVSGFNVAKASFAFNWLNEKNGCKIRQ